MKDGFDRIGSWSLFSFLRFMEIVPLNVSLFLSFFKCYIIKQLLTIEALDMM